MATFEYDPNKSASNKSKHGIDFEEAKVLFEDPHLIRFRSKNEAEPRFVVIGMIGNKHFAAVIAYRDENIRIISVRRARNSEVKLYEES